MPAKLKGACQALVECLRDMVDEETRELLGGMLDVASIKKAMEDRGLLKSVDAKASLTIDGASVRDVVIEVVESLGLAKADNPGAATMDEKTLNDKIAKAVTDATEPLSKSVTDLTKSVDDLKTENATLAKSVRPRRPAPTLPRLARRLPKSWRRTSPTRRSRRASSRPYRRRKTARSRTRRQRRPVEEQADRRHG
jgi:hypothetical protein